MIEFDLPPANPLSKRLNPPTRRARAIASFLTIAAGVLEAAIVCGSTVAFGLLVAETIRP